MTDLDECPCSGTTLSKLIQPAILSVLAEGTTHGYQIAERFSTMPVFAGREPDVSGVYRFLKSVEEKGLVASSWDLSERGPARRQYEHTVAGFECLGRWIETLEAHRERIGMLLKMARKAHAGRCKHGAA